MVAGLVLNAICPLVCFSNIVMMTEIASQRVEELAVQQTTRSGRKTGNWSRLVCSMHFNNYFVEHVRGDMNWGGGEAYRNFDLSNIFFPSPTPIYINNERSLSDFSKTLSGYIQKSL